MTRETLSVVSPPDMVPARGFAHGIVGTGRVLFVAGQIGCDAEGTVVSDAFETQFATALDHVLRVVHEAGGTASHVARMTVYVTDMAAYRGALRPLREIWRVRFGRHYPAMALVAVVALVDPRAKVEIEATAVLPLTGTDSPP